MLLEPNVARLAKEVSPRLKAAQQRHQASKIRQPLPIQWKSPR
jgi:hypothetical protein